MTNPTDRRWVRWTAVLVWFMVPVVPNLYPIENGYNKPHLPFGAAQSMHVDFNVVLPDRRLPKLVRG